MGTVHVANEGKHIIYVAGRAIPPGDGRDIEERELPAGFHKPAAAADAPAEPGLVELVTDLRAQSVKAIVAELEGLTQEALDLLSEYEQAAPSPRKSLLSALGDEHIRRADEALQGDKLDEPGADADTLKFATGGTLDGEAGHIVGESLGT